MRTARHPARPCPWLMFRVEQHHWGGGEWGFLLLFRVEHHWGWGGIMLLGCSCYLAAVIHRILEAMLLLVMQYSTFIITGDT